MRFLPDQDVYGATTHFLMKAGHDAVPAAPVGLARSVPSEARRSRGLPGMT